MMDNKELITELNLQALRVDENVHSVCERAAQALAAAYSPELLTPEVVEAAARAMCLEVDRIGGSEADELERVEHEWRGYVPAATTTLLAAFAVLGGA